MWKGFFTMRFHSSDHNKKKEEGTMASVTDNFVYQYGKRKENAKEHVVTAEQMQQIKEAAKKYLLGKK